MNSPDYSVVIPVYRSEATLVELCSRITDVFEKTVSRTFEIVLIDDASPDSSWDVMRALHERDARIKILQLARNFGQHNAILCGFAHATGAFVLTMDDDLQHPPEEISKLIRALNDHPEADVVIGAYEKKQHAWFRNAGTTMLNILISKIFKKDPKLQLTSFRLMRRIIADELVRFEVLKPRIGYLILEISNRVINTPVIHAARKQGGSGYTLSRLAEDFLGSILNNSAMPLKWMSGMGILSALTSFMLGIYYLCRYLAGGITMPGWITLVLLMLFYFGMLLLAIGLIGDYLIHILQAGRRMPQYVVRSKAL